MSVPQPTDALHRSFLFVELATVVVAAYVPESAAFHQDVGAITFAGISPAACLGSDALANTLRGAHGGVSAFPHGYASCPANPGSEFRQWLLANLAIAFQS